MTQKQMIKDLIRDAKISKATMWERFQDAPDDEGYDLWERYWHLSIKVEELENELHEYCD